jgi:hypothetical protein
MSIEQVSLDGLALPLDSTGKPVPVTDANGQIVTDANGNIVNRQSVLQGSAVEVSPGLFLSAAHVFYGPVPGPGTSIFAYKTTDGQLAINATSVNNSTNPLERAVSGSSNYAVNIDDNVSNYHASYETLRPSGNDLIAFSGGTVGTPTGVVMFLKPSEQVFSQFFASVNYGGYPAIPLGSTGTPALTSAVGSITSFDPQKGVFFVTGLTQGGMSGGGVWATAAGSNTDYILGTIEGNGGTETIANSISAQEYYQIFPTKAPKGQSGSSDDGGAKNLIVGSGDGGDLIRGTLQSASIIDSGGDNKILAGPNGDIINAGPGVDNEVFIPQNDTGTTIVVCPGSETIVGGDSKDKLVIPLDRLWTSASGVPTATSVSDSSATVQLTGGWIEPDEAEYSAISLKAPVENGLIKNYVLYATYTLETNGDLDIQIMTGSPEHVNSYSVITHPLPRGANSESMGHGSH